MLVSGVIDDTTLTDGRGESDVHDNDGHAASLRRAAQAQSQPWRGAVAVAALARRRYSLLELRVVPTVPARH
jgi:hypothetical protein